MTLAQLRSFVLVARLGSVKRAAAALAVSQPAVSAAVAALRTELGDELFVRDGHGISLTAGGRRLEALAAEILGLAEQARRSVHDSPGQPRVLQAAATSLVAEHIGPLIDAFTRRDTGIEVAVEPATGDTLAGMLKQRRADIVFGPNVGARHASAAASVPFLRCRMLLVAAPGGPLAARRAIKPAALVRQRWLVGPPEIDPTEGVGLFFERTGLRPRQIAAYTSHAAAIAAAVAGDGIVFTLAHSVLTELRSRALVALDVRGTPAVELWYASTLGLGRALPAALALQRFATTSEATQAMLRGRVGSISTRVQRGVHVTLWRSVAPVVDRARER